ncbi:MAG: hypothetical protein WCR52_17775 [Bacteroidota bacterium]
MHQTVLRTTNSIHPNRNLESLARMKTAILLASAAFLLSAALSLLPALQTPQKAMMSGPILYGINANGQLYKIDVMSCTACPIANLSGTFGGASDVLVLPNGDILVQAGGLLRYTLPDPNPIWSETNTSYGGSVIAPNGTIYLCRSFPTAGLSTYDPITNNLVFIGDWPTGMIIAEFFYQNGVLYGFGSLSGVPVVVQINTTDPSQSTVLYSGTPLGNGGTTNGGYTTAWGNSSPDILYQYNVNTNTFDFICDLNAFIPGSIGFGGLTDLPAGVPEAPCQCTTFAGTVNNQTFNVCVPGSATVPYNNNAALDGNDLLRYILFSNTNDTLGSIIVQSSSPNIAFNPATMQTGVTYYLATLAGDNLNGNVDLSDPCIDISNIAAQVTWRDKPSVSFSVGNPNVCAGDCRTVTATFTGVPPFNLTYSTPAGTFSETFSGNTGTFQVCLPSNAPPGSLLIQAIGLTDNWCSCN